jgi:hypothetical protein
MSHQHSGINCGVFHPLRQLLDWTSQSTVCHVEKLISGVGGSWIPNSRFPTELISQRDHWLCIDATASDQ